MVEERSVNAERVRRFKERWGGYKKPKGYIFFVFMIAKWRRVRYNYLRNYEEHDDSEEEKQGLYP